jgi:hypothetical protein
MLKEISDESRALILLEFTKELLMHSGYGELSELREIIEEEEKERKKVEKPEAKPKGEEIRNLVKKEEKIEEEVKKKGISPEIGKALIVKPRIISPVIIKPRVLRIPEPMLPERLRYLKPVPKNVEINLGKLNPFIADPVVRMIECNGPGENVIVMVPGPKFANIVLDKDEIRDIISTFEEKSRIPAGEGIYNVAVGKLIFSAIISDVIGSKFTIKKMDYIPLFR